MFIGFLPNLVLRFSVLSVPNFSPIRACIHVLWRILLSVRKEIKEKNARKTPQTLATRISEMAGAIYVELFIAELSTW